MQGREVTTMYTDLEMQQKARTTEPFPVAALVVAAAVLLLHLAANLAGGYGYFRDELYYIACSEHPAAGYVDQPPFSILMLSVSRLIIGDSPFALRLLPALLGAATIVLTGLMARQMGGGKGAVLLASLGAAVSPLFRGTAAVYSMNSFDHFFWALAGVLLLRVLSDPGELRLWLGLGLVLGLGLMNKISMGWFGAGIAAGLLFSRHRGLLGTRGPWIAAGTAFMLFLPYILWNAANGFPHLEFMRNAVERKYQSQNAWTFISGQVLLQNPAAIPLWAGGIAFFFARAGKTYRLLGWIFVTTFVILLINGHSKAEYLSPAYAILFAGGGVLWERLLAGSRLRKAGLAYAGLMVVFGLASLPFAVPVLPVDTYVRYAALLGMDPSTAEGHRLERLPQHYADRFGWEEKAAAVARVFKSLPAEEQGRCAIVAGNYGRCGAIDFFGRQYGLPRSIGIHNNYWLWGPRGYSGDLAIVLGGEQEDLQRYFAGVTPAGVVSCTDCMPYENNLTIFICRGIKRPLSEIWPDLKLYI